MQRPWRSDAFFIVLIACSACVVIALRTSSLEVAPPIVTWAFHINNQSRASPRANLVGTFTQNNFPHLLLPTLLLGDKHLSFLAVFEVEPSTSFPPRAETVHFMKPVEWKVGGGVDRWMGSKRWWEQSLPVPLFVRSKWCPLSGISPHPWHAGPAFLLVVDKLPLLPHVCGLVPHTTCSQRILVIFLIYDLVSIICFDSGFLSSASLWV